MIGTLISFTHDLTSVPCYGRRAELNIERKQDLLSLFLNSTGRTGQALTDTQVLRADVCSHFLACEAYKIIGTRCSLALSCVM